MTEANIAVISEVIRHITASNPAALKSLAPDIKDLIIAKAPAYRAYADEMDRRYIYELEKNRGLESSAEKDLALKEKHEKDKARELKDIADKVVQQLEEIASGDKHVLDMTIAGVIYGMTQWAKELVLLLPQLTDANPEGIRKALTDWLKQGNNLFFFGAWALLIGIIMILI